MLSTLKAKTIPTSTWSWKCMLASETLNHWLSIIIFQSRFTNSVISRYKSSLTWCLCTHIFWLLITFFDVQNKPFFAHFLCWMKRMMLYMGNKFVRYIFILFPSVSRQLISEKMLYWMCRKTFSELENKVDYTDWIIFGFENKSKIL